MVITFPCSICSKTIGDNDDSIYCDKCSCTYQNVHIKCNNLNFIDYQYLNGNDDPWFCLIVTLSYFHWYFWYILVHKQQQHTKQRH